MPFVDIDGRSLHDLDRRTGFPILFGHSYLWDSAMWAPQIEPGGTRTLGDLAGQMSDVIGCRHLIVPEAGHDSNLENASFVTAALSAFLTRQALLPPSTS